MKILFFPILLSLISVSALQNTKSHLELKNLFQPFSFPPDLNETIDWRYFSVKDDFTIYWRIPNPESTCIDWLNNGVIEIALDYVEKQNGYVGWISIGFGATSMLYADALMAHPIVSSKFTNTSAAPIKSYKNLTSPNSNDFAIFDGTIINGNPVQVDSSLSGGRNNYDYGDCHFSSTTLRLTCLTRRKLYTKDLNDYIIKPGPVPIIWAYSDLPSKAHGPLQRGTAVIEFFTCLNDTLYVKNNNVLWNTPFGEGTDAYRATQIPRRKWRTLYFIVIHAIIMLSSWIVFVPLGIYYARFSQVIEGGDRANSISYPFNLSRTNWLITHQVFTSIGFTETVTLAGASLLTGSARFETTHAVLGSVIAIISFVGAVSGFLVTKFYGKKILRWLHVIFGYVVSVLGIINCYYGFQLAFVGKTNYLNAAWALLSCWIAIMIILLIFKSKVSIATSFLMRLIGLEFSKSSLKNAGSNELLPKFTEAEFLENIKRGSQWFRVGNQIFSVHGFNHPGGADFLKLVGQDISHYFIRKEGVDPVKRPLSPRKLSSVMEGAKENVQKVVLNLKSMKRVTPVSNNELPDYLHSRFALSKLQSLLIGQIVGVVTERPAYLKSRDLSSSVIVEENSHELAITELKFVSPRLLLARLSSRGSFLPPKPDQGSFMNYSIRIFTDDQGSGRQYTPINYGLELELMIGIRPKGYNESILLPLLKSAQRNGTSIKCSSPIDYYKSSIPKEIAKRYILISAGSGASPMLQFINYLYLRNLKPEITWISCHEHMPEVEMLLENFLCDGPNRPPIISKKFYLKNAPLDKPITENCIVTGQRLDLSEIGICDDCLALVCGTDGFILDVESQLSQKEVPFFSFKN